MPQHNRGQDGPLLLFWQERTSGHDFQEESLEPCRERSSRCRDSRACSIVATAASRTLKQTGPLHEALKWLGSRVLEHLRSFTRGNDALGCNCARSGH